jgi:hypothetical protein
MKRPKSRVRKVVVTDEIVELFRKTIPTHQAHWRAICTGRDLPDEKHFAALVASRKGGRAMLRLTATAGLVSLSLLAVASSPVCAQDPTAPSTSAITLKTPQKHPSTSPSPTGSKGLSKNVEAAVEPMEATADSLRCVVRPRKPKQC